MTVCSCSFLLKGQGTIPHRYLLLARRAQFLSSPRCQQDPDSQTSTVGCDTQLRSWGTQLRTCSQGRRKAGDLTMPQVTKEKEGLEQRLLYCRTHPDQAYLARPIQGESVEADVFGTTLTSLPRS